MCYFYNSTVLFMKHYLIIALAVCCCVSAAADDSDATCYLDRQMPDAWSYHSDFEPTLPADDIWWHEFGDQLLDSLITEATTGNYDVRMAVRRIAMAREAVGVARAGYYPSLSLGAGYTKGREAGAMTSSSAQSVNTGYFNLGVDVAWQIDLFGRVTSQVAAGKAQADVSRADYLSAMVSVAAEVATYYMNLRTQQAQLQVAREHLQQQKRVVEIAEARHQAGLVSKLDVARAKTVYYSTEAAIPQLERSIRVCANAIAVLLGQYPDAMRARLEAPAPQPDCRRLIAAGVPADLLRRRPDIIAAERQIAAYAAQCGVARKDYLPALTLEGSVGVAAHDIGDMFRSNSLQYSIAPRLSWTIFDGLSRKYAVAEARERMQLGIEQYNSTVMGAFSEVDNAMTSYLTALRTIDLDRNVFDQSREAFDLALEQYKGGLTSLNDVVDAQISWLDSADSLVAARGDALTSLIQIYRSLGGSPVQ